MVMEVLERWGLAGALNELRTNRRARLLLLGGGLAVFLAIIVQASGAISSAKADLADRTAFMARLEATAQETDWLNRRATIESVRAQMESRLWPLETEGLATVEFQDWLNRLGRESVLVINETRPAIEPAPSHAGLRKMTVTLTGPFDAGAMERFLVGLARQNRMAVVERLRITTTPAPRFEMAVVTYTRSTAGSAPSPRQQP